MWTQSCNMWIIKDVLNILLLLLPLLYHLVLVSTLTDYLLTKFTEHQLTSNNTCPRWGKKKKSVMKQTVPWILFLKCFLVWYRLIKPNHHRECMIQYVSNSISCSVIHQNGNISILFLRNPSRAMKECYWNTFKICWHLKLTRESKHLP